MKRIRVPFPALIVAATAALALSGNAGAAQPYATVISATPIVAQTGAPREECVAMQRAVPQQTSGGGALIGAIVGGVIGNQIGHGFGRAAATGIGAVGGAAIGNSVEANRSGYAVQRHCRIVTGSASRVIGYDVVYEYNGQRYHTRTASDPGPRMAVDVRPAAEPIAYQPVPAVTTTTRPETYVESLPPQPIDSPTAEYQSAPPAYYRGAPYHDGSPYYGYGWPAWYGPPAYWGPTFGIGIGGGHRHHGHHRNGRRH